MLKTMMRYYHPTIKVAKIIKTDTIKLEKQPTRQLPHWLSPHGRALGMKEGQEVGSGGV